MVINMETHNDKQYEIERKEAELKAREQALRLRELEAELSQNKASQEPPISPTCKHEPSPNSLAVKWKKMVKFVKFLGFTLLGIALLRVGLMVGLWLSYVVLAGIIGFIGYKIFLAEDS
ncbi:MAG: hypothetical protein AB4041_21975 [Microcystaceae cyanobacterium]